MIAVTADSPRSRVSAFVRRSVATPFDAALSATVVVIVVAAAIPLARWALLDAVWSGTAEDCRAVERCMLGVRRAQARVHRVRALSAGRALASGLALGALVALIVADRDAAVLATVAAGRVGAGSRGSVLADARRRGTRARADAALGRPADHGDADGDRPVVRLSDRRAAGARAAIAPARCHGPLRPRSWKSFAACR